MDGPEPFDDPGPLVPQPPSRARRVATIAIVVALIVSMVFLAFVSGRGLITPAPAGPDQPAATLPVAATTVSPSPAAPRRLAVVDAAGRLAIADDTGTVSAPLGDPATAYSFPAWSPDGTRIAVIGGDGGTGVVHVFSVGSGPTAADGPVAVYDSVDHPPFYLYWSPDGSRVSFLTTEPGGGIALRVAPADGSAGADVVREGAPMYWAWSGANALVIHSGGAAPDAFVGEVSLDGTPIEPTVRGSAGFRAPAISADRAFIGYVAPGSGSAPQVVVEPRDINDRQAVDVLGEAAIDFSPTAPDLAFIAPDAPGPELAFPVGPLRVLSAKTGDVRVLLPAPVVAFFWAPDGRTIAALQVGQPTDDNVARTDGRAVLARARVATSAATAAAGVSLRLVFVDPSTGATRGARAVTVGDLFVTQILTYFDQYAQSHRFWSPDSSTIALPLAADDGSSTIVSIPTDGGPTTRLADGVIGFWSP